MGSRMSTVRSSMCGGRCEKYTWEEAGRGVMPSRRHPSFPFTPSPATNLGLDLLAGLAVVLDEDVAQAHGEEALAQPVLHGLACGEGG